MLLPFFLLRAARIGPGGRPGQGQDGQPRDDARRASGAALGGGALPGTPGLGGNVGMATATGPMGGGGRAG